MEGTEGTEGTQGTQGIQGAEGTQGASGAPPATPPAADLREFLEPNGNFKEGWAEKFGLNPAQMKRFTSLASLGKSYESLESSLGKKGVIVPDANSTDEAWNDFYAKVGRPEKPEGYEIKRPDDFPEALWDGKRIADFQAVAHKAGLTPRQAGALVAWESQFVKQAVESQNAASESAKLAAMDALKKEWGVLFERKCGDALRMAEVLDPALAKDPVLANNPAFIRALAKMQAMVSETPIFGSRNEAGGPQSARQRLDAIMSNRDDPYWKPNHPGHGARVDEVLALRAASKPA